MKESTKQFKVQTSEFAKFLTKSKGLVDLFEIQSAGKVALPKKHTSRSFCPLTANPTPFLKLN